MTHSRWNTGVAALLLATSPARAVDPAPLPSVTPAVDPQIESAARCAALYTFFSVFIGKDNPAGKAALKDAAVRWLKHASKIPPKNAELVSERFKANNDALVLMLKDPDARKVMREQLGGELKSCAETETTLFGTSVRDRKQG